jgi:hypothetical protein
MANRNMKKWLDEVKAMPKKLPMPKVSVDLMVAPQYLTIGAFLL